MDVSLVLDDPQCLNMIHLGRHLLVIGYLERRGEGNVVAASCLIDVDNIDVSLWEVSARQLSRVLHHRASGKRT